MKNLLNDDLAVLNACCKHLEKGWVGNRLTGDLYKDLRNDVFAVIVPDFDKHLILVNGCITWGLSGFRFSLKADLKSEQNKPKLTINRHKDCVLGEQIIKDIVFDLIYKAKKKISGKLKGKEKYRFQEPMLKAFNKNKRKISQRSINNINYFKQEGIFDLSFRNFLLKHEVNGIKCDGRKSRNYLI